MTTAGFRTELAFVRSLQRKYGRRGGHRAWRTWLYERLFGADVEPIQPAILTGWRAGAPCERCGLRPADPPLTTCLACYRAVRERAG